ncbi:MAG: hypothetical protein ACMXX7_01655 [Candidatus Woesearchaeota archaeon]
MNKYIIILLTFSILFLAGCSTDTYFEASTEGTLVAEVENINLQEDFKDIVSVRVLEVNGNSEMFEVDEIYEFITQYSSRQSIVNPIVYFCPQNMLEIDIGCISEEYEELIPYMTTRAEDIADENVIVAPGTYVFNYRFEVDGINYSFDDSALDNRGLYIEEGDYIIDVSPRITENNDPFINEDGVIVFFGSVPEKFSLDGLNVGDEIEFRYDDGIMYIAKYSIIN